MLCMFVNCNSLWREPATFVFVNSSNTKRHIFFNAILKKQRSNSLNGFKKKHTQKLNNFLHAAQLILNTLDSSFQKHNIYLYSF